AEIFGRLFSHGFPRREAGGGEQRFELRLGPTGFQIFNHSGLGARSLDHCQDVARRRALRVMINGDALGHHTLHVSATVRAISACAALRTSGPATESLKKQAMTIGAFAGGQAMAASVVALWASPPVPVLSPIRQLGARPARSRSLPVLLATSQ